MESMLGGTIGVPSDHLPSESHVHLCRIYSGTVAGAREALMGGVPAVALSMEDKLVHSLKHMFSYEPLCTSQAISLLTCRSRINRQTGRV
jgi:hypothetical protein